MPPYRAVVRIPDTLSLPFRRAYLQNGGREKTQMAVSSPFVIGIIGDFSGRGGAPGLEERLAQKRFLPVDRDDFDDRVWRYNLYHNQGPDLGARVELESGFGFSTAGGEYGWRCAATGPAVGRRTRSARRRAQGSSDQA